MMQLPEIKQLDIATPIQTYYANKRQSERDQLQGEVQRGNMEINRGNLEMNRMKLDEYKAGAPERAKEAEMKRVMEALTMNEGFVKLGKDQLLSLDENSKDFSKQVAERAGQMASYLKDDLKVPPEYIRGVINIMAQATPEGVRELKTKAKMLANPGETPRKFENGQFLTLDEQGNPIAKKVSGYEKPPLSNLATATDVDDYVSRANNESIRTTGQPLTYGEQNKAALEFKRAQAPEAYATAAAKTSGSEEIKEKHAQSIAKNAELGKMLAQIEKNHEVIKSKGEDTPVEKRERGQKGVTVATSMMTRLYTKLDDMGGITNTENSAIENVWASMKSSNVGQAFGTATGLEEQSFRKQINQIKPTLINDIRQGADMGARGMDSEKELAFYLQAVSDEKADVGSAYAAIYLIDKKFGTGQVASVMEREGKLNQKKLEKLGKSADTAKKSPPPKGSVAGGVNPQTGEMEYFDKEGNKI